MPQNVHIAGITLTPTAVAAADTLLSKWWYLLAVVHGVLLCYCTLTPYTTMHTSCVETMLLVCKCFTITFHLEIFSFEHDEIKIWSLYRIN